MEDDGGETWKENRLDNDHRFVELKKWEKFESYAMYDLFSTAKYMHYEPQRPVETMGLVTWSSVYLRSKYTTTTM